MYVLIGEDNEVEKFPFFEGELKRRHKNVSFPSQIPEETLNAFNVFKVMPTPIPPYDPFTEKVKTTVIFEEGAWRQNHEVKMLPDEIIFEKIKERVKDELAGTLDDVMFYLEKNTPVPEKLVSFRRYMREIEHQEGYPRSLKWPPKPVR